MKLRLWSCSKSSASRGILPFGVLRLAGRRVVLGHTFSTPQYVITHTQKSHNVLSKFTVLCWAAFTAILGCIRPAGCRLDTAVRVTRFCLPRTFPVCIPGALLVLSKPGWLVALFCAVSKGSIACFIDINTNGQSERGITCCSY